MGNENQTILHFEWFWIFLSIFFCQYMYSHFRFCTNFLATKRRQLIIILRIFSNTKGDDAISKRTHIEDNQSSQPDILGKSSDEATTDATDPTNESNVEPMESEISYASASVSSELNDNRFTMDLTPVPISASYVVPGSGTLKETHIFTPSKGAATCINSLENRVQAMDRGGDQDNCPVGIVINENVVKKEYHDVVYEPKKLHENPKNPLENFDDFHTVEPPTCIAATEKMGLPILPFNSSGSALQPQKTFNPIGINWPESAVVDNSVGLNDITDIQQTQIASEAALAVSTGPTSDSSTSVNETLKPKELPTPKEYSKPKIGVSPSDFMFSTSAPPIADDFDDEFSEFQSKAPQKECVANIPNILPPMQTSKFILPLSERPSHMQPVAKPTAPTDNAGLWPQVSVPIEPIPALSSIPMVPLQPEVKPAKVQQSNVPTIEWPEPGIDPDEMARLEALFPQSNSANKLGSKTETNTLIPTTATVNHTNNDADEEWSDFVSVSEPQLPITNILNQNLQKHHSDDDDWSEFVSSNGAAPASTWNSVAGPNFTAWNAPSSLPYGDSNTIYQSYAQQMPIPPPSMIATSDFIGLNSARIHANSLTNSFNQANVKSQISTINNGNGKIPLRPMQQQHTAAPSVISMPDLGFVAPKTLMNMSRNNSTKK